METSETKPASRRARFWARLSDPDKPPRCWWFPPSSRRDHVLRLPEVARQGYRAMVQQRHAKLSETIRLAMLSLLGFALFCLLIVLSAPDSSLLVADPMVKMPFADVQVSFPYFLILAPFLLIIITVYLHIFYGYWLDVETDYQHLTCSREPSEPFIAQVPTLFSLDDFVSRHLTTFIFYWLVPLVLGAMTWKAAIRLTWGLYLVISTSLVTAMLVFLQIRRCPTSQRKWNRPYWVVMALIVVGVVGIMFDPEKLERQLNIFRADLKGKWLGGADLHNAYGPMVNFEGAELPVANLQSANLVGAKLKDANLMLANLKSAQLQGAQLQCAQLQAARLEGTNLQGANLQGASFQFAHLDGAVLVSANLREADFQKAQLQGAQLHGAQLQGAKLQGVNIESAGLMFALADLEGADLRGVNLQGATLLLTNLQGANLQGANLQGADLGLAKLQGADLQDAKIEKAKFGGADLTGADLEKASLREADLRGAKLSGVNFVGADLWFANLRGANLRDAKLSGANFLIANLQRADLMGADLTGANLAGAKLQGADLQSARLRGADLRGVDLQEIKNLTEEQIQSAYTNAGTLLPDYLKRPIP